MCRVQVFSASPLVFVLGMIGMIGMVGCYRSTDGRENATADTFASAGAPTTSGGASDGAGWETSAASAAPDGVDSWPGGTDSGETMGSGDPSDSGNAPDPECVTNGAGGLADDVENLSFTDSLGRTSLFHVYASGVPESGTTGLLLYFHGDGAVSFNQPQNFVRDIAKVAAEHNLMLVALRTPNSDTTWWTTGDSNALWARELLERELYAKYNIDRSRVLLVGYSGGAEFVSEYYTTDHHDTLCGGGAIIFGGGGIPFDAHTVSFDPAFVESFALHWHTGQLDTGCAISGLYCNNYNAYADSQTGVAFYESHGFTVTAEFPPDKDHYNLEFVKAVRNQLEGPWASF